VAESLASGASVTEVARRHDVHPNLLHCWRRRVRTTSAAGGRLSFLPVAVSVEKRRPSSAEGAIEIELDGGVRLRVDASVDEVALGRVLRALGR
jgi:transposase